MIESDESKGRGQTGDDREPPRPVGEGEGPRRIVLFSDGTGNSSAKLFKTNVWRMYEAVDLGPPEAGDHKQIAFYDNGVGTSALKPVAALGAVFGIGLKRNVLDIYRYACRNYQPGPDQKPGEAPGERGDHIYGFGFSRGAFTMRIVIDLIGSQGLVTSNDEAELKRRSEQAWRAYRKPYLPRSRLSATIVLAWRRMIGHRGDDYDPSQNYRPVIQFLGVWDTVAAYGGPITEITRAIDNWFFRLTMVDYELGPDVRCARHALSIDDERDAFRPLPWDEIAEEKLRNDPERTKGRPWLTPSGPNAAQRVEQVWFTGMHADVGGGYPDESLSFVSFLWMMEEAKKAKLRPVPTIVDHFRALASSDGPIHDSRAGFGSYYRYQPRKIGAWLEPIDPTTFAQRDPDLGGGLIKVVKVHESVAARIASGTDRYAPITLPAAIRIVPPQAEGENAPLETSEVPTGTDSVILPEQAAKIKGPPRPLISRALRERLENPLLATQRVAAMAPVWRMVAARRALYFLILLLTLLLLGMPVWIDRWLAIAAAPPVFASGHGILGSVFELMAAILPAFLAGLIGAWAAHPFYFLILLVGILLARQAGAVLERNLRDKTRRIWNQATDIRQPLPQGPPAPPTIMQPSRAQYLGRWIKWSLLPGLIGLLIVALALWLLLVGGTRTTLAVRERLTFCEPSATPLPELAVARRWFSTAETCVPMGASVERGKTYIVDFDVTELWQDGSFHATPAGLRAGEIGFAGISAAPLRRAVGASYLQPMVHIRTPGKPWAGPSIMPLRLVQQGGSRRRWRGSFVAPQSGELSLFANDVAPAVPLSVKTNDGRRWWDTDNFYANNCGSAWVTIVRADQVPGLRDQRRQSANAGKAAACAGR